MSVGKIFARNQSAEFDSSSQAITASEKVLVPDNLDDGDSLVTDELQGPSSFSEESKVDISCHLCSLIRELYMQRQIVGG